MPKKPLLKINGKSIISHVVNRAKHAKLGIVYGAEDYEILNDVKNGGSNNYK